MAAITWRSIDIPQFDTRGLSQAGQTISNSFDRFAALMSQRETAARDEATNAAIAQQMALQDPEAVKAALAQGTAGLGKRVDGLRYMQSLGAHQNQLVERSMNQEQLYKTQDGRVNAASYGRLGQLAKEFETADANRRGEIEMERASLLEQMQASNGGYAATDTWNAGIQLGDKDQDQILDTNKFGEQKRSNMATEGIQMFTARSNAARDAEAIAASRESRAQARLDRQRQEAQRANLDAVWNKAGAVAQDLLSKGVTDPEGIKVGLRRSNYFNSLKTPAEQEAFLNRVTDTMANKTTRSGEERERLGLPGFENSIDNALRAVGVQKLAKEREFGHDNPTFDVANQVAALKGPITEKQALDALYTQQDFLGWDLAGDTMIRKALKERRVTPEVLYTLAKSGDFRNFRGEADFLDVAERSTQFLLKGNPEGARMRRDEFLSPLTTLEAQLSKARAKAEEYGRNGKPVPKTLQAEVEAIRRKLVAEAGG